MNELTDRERALFQRCRTDEIVLDLRRPVNGRALIWHDGEWQVIFESPRGTRTRSIETDADYVMTLLAAAISASCHSFNQIKSIGGP